VNPYVDIRASADIVLEIEAASLTVEGQQGVNRLPFVGTLFIVGEPSDRPPHGTGGKKLLIDEVTAKAALDSIIGMPVNANIELDEHVQRLKVGVIMAAKIEGNRFIVSGHLFDKDFPREVNAIRLAAARNESGMSLETAKTLLQDAIFNGEIVAKAVSLVFTGAAILLKENAAYGGKTDLAATKERRILMELKDLLDAINGLETKITAKVDKAIEDIKKDVDTKITAATAVKPGEKKEEKKVEPSEEMKTLTAAVADLTKTVSELKAGTVTKKEDEVPPEVKAYLEASGMKLVAEKPEKKEEEPKRRTVTPELLARFGAKDEETAIDASTIDTLAQKTGLNNVQSIALKLEARKAGLIK
jgi:hypothetical protein